MLSSETAMLAAVLTVFFVEGVGVGGQELCAQLCLSSLKTIQRENSGCHTACQCLREVRAEVGKGGEQPLNKAT